jgi:hypothetical protein
MLLIDGLFGAFRQEGYDPDRLQSLYDQLAEIGQTYQDRLQIIVCDKSVPDSVRGYVRLQLSEDERLIPAEDLIALRRRNSLG